MARKFMTYLEEMTGVAACGTVSGDVATFAKPVGSPVRRSFPSSVLGIDSARITFPKKRKNK